RERKLKLIILVRFGKGGNNKSRAACAAMTLPEILISIVILAAVMGGIIMGYVQANRKAEFSSMSLAAQSTALQGMEQAIASRWDSQNSTDTNNGPGHADELGCITNWNPATNTVFGSNNVNVLDIPVSGAAIPVTNYITISWISSTRPLLRQIRSDAVWTFPYTGTTYTNTVI